MKKSYNPYYNTYNCCENTIDMRAIMQDMYSQDPADMTPSGMPVSPNFPGMTEQMQQGNLPQTTNPLAPIQMNNQPPPATAESLEYLNGFLRTQIGKKVRVEFLIGTGTLVDKSGTLLAVGANYIIINQLETDDNIVCDFYTIKFITFYL